MAPHLSATTLPPARPPQRRSSPTRRALRASAPSAIVAALLLGACGGSLDSKNLGDTAEESSAAAPVSPAPLRSFMGSWIGEAEDPLGAPLDTGAARYHFPSGSKLFRLVISEMASASISGALTFGEGTRPPRPTADTASPPGVDYASPSIYTWQRLPPVEGHIYRVKQSANGPDDNVIDDGGALQGPFSLRDGVLLVELDMNEPIAPWCGLQAPLQAPLSEDNGYSCVGDAYRYPASLDAPASCFSSADNTPVDCGKYFLCAVGNPPICSCYDSGCNIRSDSVGLFLRLDGSDLVGVFSNGLFARADGRLASIGTVRFHPAP